MLLSVETGFARITELRMGSRVTSDTAGLIQGSGVLPLQPELDLPSELRWHMAGPKVAIGAVSLLADEIRSYLARDCMFDWLIPHQANRRGIMVPACEKAGVPVEKMLSTIEWMGNTSTASVPLTFDHYHRQQHFRPYDRVLLISFGASFSVASALVEIAPPCRSNRG